MKKTKLEKFLFVDPGTLSDEVLLRWARACLRTGLKNLRRRAELEARLPSLSEDQREEYEWLREFAWSRGQVRYLCTLLGEKFPEQDLLPRPESDILRPWRQTPLPRTGP